MPASPTEQNNTRWGLISRSRAFDSAAAGYEDNVVVHARMIGAGPS